MTEGCFKVGTLASMTGLGIPTLRNWERRYGLLRPQRMASGHRLYTMDDLTTLRRVKALLNDGRPIGEIAALGRETLLDDGARSGSPPPQPNLLEHVGRMGEAIPHMMLDALPCGVVLTDALGRTQWVNRSVERICGYGLADLRGRTPGSVLQGRHTDPRTVRQLSEAVARLQSCNARILNYAAGHREYWADLEIVPFMLGAEPRGFIATVRDVTDDVEQRSFRIRGT